MPWIPGSKPNINLTIVHGNRSGIFRIVRLGPESLDQSVRGSISRDQTCYTM